jgi:phospholipid/cholesterol/gamma-HCH transport system substrate-binding protein
MGDGSMVISVDLAQIANLVPNAEVKVNDVTVGSVVASEVEDWHARLTVALDGSVKLPANSIARVAQKSLLGAEHLEISPPVGQPPVGQLRDGDTIPLERTGRYPETEEVLAALSVVLNGSGLQQVKTITAELNEVLGGRQGDVRELLTNLQDLVGTLDDQRDDITAAMDGLARFGTVLAQDNAAIAEGLERIPPALETLNTNREDLIKALEATAEFGDVAVDVVTEVRSDLLANLRSLQPTLEQLANSGNDLTESVSMIATYPFPANTSFPGMLKGDYGNLFAVVDITPEVLARNLLAGFEGPLPDAAPLLELPPLGSGEPMESPFAPFLPAPGPGVPAPLPEPDNGLLDSLLPGGGG